MEEEFDIMKFVTRAKLIKQVQDIRDKNQSLDIRIKNLNMMWKYFFTQDFLLASN